ncbi:MULTISPECIES: LytTR family DNA-binding domain-containing protein [unclassified Undibacterium]|uniref:LytR/AlgR family response regulator transcription factor n=1 Tax=unclassified Undibacterium TaxID=2630295 RepID=UPI002AC9B2F8|nr:MULTISPECIES: LytTR family DNA-binding domain-containing protein [unclassified Undibacterium]MEB0214477.1 LytTR family DNA-binding domain-containing protein [Undibacterium sp. 5I2]WPX42874.1 LytTR family DNA-binding domain-containing protein [Undibacterium sp. CCC3.4]
MPRVFIIANVVTERQSVFARLAALPAQGRHLIVGAAHSTDIGLTEIRLLRPEIVVAVANVAAVQRLHAQLRHMMAVVPNVIGCQADGSCVVFPAAPSGALPSGPVSIHLHNLCAAIIYVRERARAKGAPVRDFFSVIEHRRHVLVPVREVLFLQAGFKYVSIATREKEFLTEESLITLEREMPDHFIRLHRNTLVARSAVLGIERGNRFCDVGTPTEHVSTFWQVVVSGSEQRLRVSRRRWQQISKLLR